MSDWDDPLHQDLDAYHKARIKGLWTRVAIFVALILFLCINLGLMLAEFRRWDARTVVITVGGRIEQALPDAQQQLETFVLDSAPGLLDIAQRRIMAEPAKQRARAEVVVGDYARERLATYRSDLDALLDKSIDDGLADLDKVGPDQARPEQLSAIIDGIVAAVEQDWSDYFTTAGTAYQEDLASFSTYMRTLADGGPLERKKRIERNLIQASLALHQRAGQRSDAAKAASP